MSLCSMILQSYFASKRSVICFTLKSLFVLVLTNLPSSARCLIVWIVLHQFMQFSSFYSCEHFIAESTCSKVISFYFVLTLPYFYTDILVKYSQFNFTKLATIMNYMMMNLMIKQVYSAFVTISWYSCIFLAIGTVS